MTTISDILARAEFTRDDIVALLSASDPADVELIRASAEQVLLANCGDTVYYRGLIEFSNVCAMDCLYCGIRKSNPGIRRFTLSKKEILDAALWCAEQGYGSVVLQSGERRDKHFVDLVEDVVRSIKAATKSERLPEGLGITLSVGEQSRATYDRFFAAGAHRYLLRIETSGPALFPRIHPAGQQLDTRIRCLRDLRDAGFQVGTGVMIGLPGQTVAMLADDILFFRDMDVDMIGMGPYIVHRDTPMAGWPESGLLSRDDALRLSLLMIAVTRLVLRDVNIAATTALQAIHPLGREEGLRHGANVIMPQLTPSEYRRDYLLYEGKPCLEEDKEDCKNCLRMRIESVGRRVGRDEWGDSRHAAKRQEGSALSNHAGTQSKACR